MDKRCQAMVDFRPDPWHAAPWMAGPVCDRMRCTNDAIETIRGVALCGIHSFDQASSDRAIRRGIWPSFPNHV